MLRRLSGYMFVISSIFLLFSSIWGTSIFAESFVPDEYLPNYHIAEERDGLLSLIIEIEASQKVGAEMDKTQFTKLQTIFQKVFQYFPSTPQNDLIYKQCDLTTKSLATEVTRNDYAIFKERCFTPIGNLINKIQADFTVKADVIVKPKQWAAPLNVTFDARNSTDPSSETIPADNFFWYYKDIYGDDRMIGRGYVVNYTFENPGNHIIHLTVRSANNLTEWIFDGEKDVSVNVAPPAADIAVRVNNQLLSTDGVFRIGTYDAKKGILIDGTSITPIGARTIVEYMRTITSAENNYNFKKSGEGSPGQFVHKFPYNGKYFLTINLTDNENNKLSEKYEISISDPVSIIKMTPKDGTTSNEYKFDASASYSLTSRVKTYQWLIRDPNGKEEIVESKKLTRAFTHPGNYLVKLTVIDELGNSSYDEEQFYVKSTLPVPSFMVTPSSDLTSPSQFILDAMPTFDVDVTHGHDELSYAWSIFPSDSVEIIEQDDTDKKILVNFSNKGEYVAKLRVNDSYGESVEIEKKIKVDSSLRPQMQVHPKVSQRWEKITFTAEVNKPVAYYEWNFGDGNVQKSSDATVSHSYEQAGDYNVALRVVNEDGEENTVKDYVFMGQKNMPVSAYEVKVNQQQILQPTSTCLSVSGENMLAYPVERYQHFMFDASKSVNTQWWTTDISLSLHPQNDEVITKSIVDYHFLEVGCHYIDLFTEDSNVGKTDTTRVRFDVTNALPTLDNLMLTFPQNPNTDNLGIGANPLQSNTQNILAQSSMDPIFASVEAKGSKDPDGFISHYAWYYYETKNPNNIIALKITPSTVPHTTFVIPKPRYAAEYSFAVRMVDNDGAETTSEDILGKWPVVFFPPGENNLDVPIITLTSNQWYVKVGEEITFTTQSEILSKRPDFASTRYFKYDFDGDGEYDLTTKKESVTHIYQQEGEKYPKVTVFYRGRAWVGITEKIIVQKWLKPKILIDSFDNKILGKDVSIGSIEDRTLCLDTNKCHDDDHWLLTGNASFLFAYDAYGSHEYVLEVSDSYGNEQSLKGDVVLKKERTTGEPSLLAIPWIDKGDEKIHVGKNMWNSLLLYVLYDDGTCFMDMDITEDTDKNGDPTDDQDVQCNAVRDIAFTPTKKEQTSRIYYAWNKAMKTKNIVIDFMDYEEITNEAYKDVYPKIDALINEISEQGDDTVSYYKSLLVNLKASLGEIANMNSTLIQLRSLLDSTSGFLTADQRAETLELISELSDSDVQQVLWWFDYETVKTNTLVRFDEVTKEQVMQTFKQFEASEWKDPGTRKQILDEVIKLAAKAKDEGTIDITDYNYIQKNLCDIVKYYSFSSKTCGTAVEIDPALLDEAEQDAERGSSSSSSFGTKILKIVIIVVVILAVIFGALVLFFAIKARKNNNDEDDDDDEDEDDDIIEELEVVAEDKKD